MVTRVFPPAQGGEKKCPIKAESCRKGGAHYMLSNLNEKKTERKGRECPLRADAAVRHAGQLPTTRSLSFLCLILGLITYPSSRAEEDKSPPRDGARKLCSPRLESRADPPPGRSSACQLAVGLSSLRGTQLLSPAPRAAPVHSFTGRKGPPSTCTPVGLHPIGKPAGTPNQHRGQRV